jgi:hypothetical protein
MPHDSLGYGYVHTLTLQSRRQGHAKTVEVDGALLVIQKRNSSPLTVPPESLQGWNRVDDLLLVIAGWGKCQ